MGYVNINGLCSDKSNPHMGYADFIIPAGLLSVTNDWYDSSDLLIPPQNKKIAWLPPSTLLDSPFHNNVVRSCDHLSRTFKFCMFCAEVFFWLSLI